MTLKGAKFVGRRPGPALTGSLQFSRGWSGKGLMEKMLFGQRLEEDEALRLGLFYMGLKTSQEDNGPGQSA